MASDKTIWFYVGGGAYFPGVPCRDLSDADMEMFTATQRADVEAGTIFQRSKPTGERASLSNVPAPAGPRAVVDTETSTIATPAKNGEEG